MAPGLLHQLASAELHMVDDVPGVVAILKDNVDLRYFHLSAVGLFIWKNVDGQRAGQDLIAMGAQLLACSPEEVSASLSHLQAAGFVLSFDRLANGSPKKANFSFSYKNTLVWHITFTNHENFFRVLYKLTLSKFFFCKLATVVLLFLSLIGFALLIHDPYQTEFAGGYVGVMLAAVTVATLLHELAHALAVTHYGRRVNGYGVGWYWMSPSFFIDTSDMWLGTRKQRAVVAAAGPTIESAAAGVLVIIAEVYNIGHEIRSSLFWSAQIIYSGVFLNICPCLENDGYHFLSDLIGVSNLKEKSYKFVASKFSTNVPIFDNRRFVANAERRVVCAPRRALGLIYISYVAGTIFFLCLSAWLLAAAIVRICSPWTGGLLFSKQFSDLSIVSFLVSAAVSLYFVVDFRNVLNRRARG